MPSFKLPSRQPNLPLPSMGRQMPLAQWVNPALVLRPHIRECPRCQEPVECPFPWVGEHLVLRRLSPDSPPQMLPCLERMPDPQDRRQVLEQVYSPQQVWRRML